MEIKIKGKRKVKSAYRFPNGMVAVFGYDDEQIPELQGEYTDKLYQKIIRRSDDTTEFNGFN